MNRTVLTLKLTGNIQIVPPEQLCEQQICVRQQAEWYQSSSLAWITLLCCLTAGWYAQHLQAAHCAHVRCHTFQPQPSRLCTIALTTRLATYRMSPHHRLYQRYRVYRNTAQTAYIQSIQQSIAYNTVLNRFQFHQSQLKTIKNA